VNDHSESRQDSPCAEEEIEAIAAALAIKWHLSDLSSEHVANRWAALTGAVPSMLGAVRLIRRMDTARFYTLVGSTVMVAL
jgi:hypothetical protein